MNSPAPSSASQNNESSRRLFADLVSHLRNTQDSDGGWPFHAGGASRVEPACWALLALANQHDAAQQQIANGLQFLKTQQLTDGSWPAANGMSSGGWVTSLAAFTLAQFPASEKSVLAALQWLCDDYPRDSSRWQKFLKSFSSAKHESHNNEFRGWGWTPRTSSWVEPTSFALLAFASAAPSARSSSLAKQISAQLEAQVKQRRALAVGLLYDRMCAGGGWNCGNPRVYGVDGDSLILPTCWALLALRDEAEHPHRALSLDWLQKSFANIASPGSLAVAQITLENYNVPLPPASRRLCDFPAADLAGQGTHVAAWAALALNPTRPWFTQSQPKAGEGPSHESPA
jgi:hypothetical protein